MLTPLRKLFIIIFLLIFMFQIGYLSYQVPQIIILGKEFPDEIKLSLVVAGLCLGFMYILKDRSNPDPPEE